jgi:hypothetical protein
MLVEVKEPQQLTYQGFRGVSPASDPEAKKRAKQLEVALLGYGSDELNCDAAALNAVRSHIQTHWQTDHRLVSVKRNLTTKPVRSPAAPIPPVPQHPDKLALLHPKPLFSASCSRLFSQTRTPCRSFAA